MLEADGHRVLWDVLFDGGISSDLVEWNAVTDIRDIELRSVDFIGDDSSFLPDC